MKIKKLNEKVTPYYGDSYCKEIEAEIANWDFNDVKALTNLNDRQITMLKMFIKDCEYNLEKINFAGWSCVNDGIIYSFENKGDPKLDRNAEQCWKWMCNASNEILTSGYNALSKLYEFAKEILKENETQQ